MQLWRLFDVVKQIALRAQYYESQVERESQLRKEVKGIVSKAEDYKFCGILNKAFKDLITQKTTLWYVAVYAALADFDLM